MPNIKSAKKRVLVSEKKALQNKMYKSALKTSLKKYESAVSAGNKELASSIYKMTVKKIDQAVAAGMMHKNTAAHKKSRFTKMLNEMA